MITGRQRMWIPEKPPVVEICVPSMQCTLEGIFYLELIDAKTKKVKQSFEFHNLLTDSGMDGIGVGGNGGRFIDFYNYLGVGTSNTTPLVTDTTLGAELVRVNANEGITDVVGFVTGSGYPTNKSGSYHFRRVNRVFDETQANGNLTELGWFDLSSAGTMLIRSLIKDSTGTPVTITKTSNDQLRVKHEIRLYPPTQITTGSVIVGAVTYSYSASVLGFSDTGVWGYFDGTGIGYELGIWTWVVAACPSASRIIDQTGSAIQFNGNVNIGSVDGSSVSSQTYVGGSFVRDVIATWSTSKANYGPGGVKGFVMTPASVTLDYAHQILLTSSIPKTSALTLAVKFRQPFGRTVI